MDDTNIPVAAPAGDDTAATPVVEEEVVAPVVPVVPEETPATDEAAA